MGMGLTDSYKLEGPNSEIKMSEFIRRELEMGKIREEIMQSVLTQIQKERIRDEIILDEILRRRFMKADVERELSIERELALPGLSPHEIVGRPQLSLPHEMMGRPRGLLPHEMVGRPRGSLPHEMVGRPRVSLPHEIVGRPIGESCTSSLDGAESQQLDDYVQPSGTLIEGNEEHKKNSFTFWCDMCQMGTNSEYNMEIHCAGKKHHLAQKKNLLTFCCDVVDKHKAGNKHCLAQKKQLFRFWCDLCQIGTDTEDMMEKHKAGSKHHLAQKKQLFECWCDVCQIGTNSETVMEMHKAGKKHLANKKQLFRFWYGKKHQAQLQKCSSSTGGDKRSGC